MNRFKKVVKFLAEAVFFVLYYTAMVVMYILLGVGWFLKVFVIGFIFGLLLSP